MPMTVAYTKTPVLFNFIWGSRLLITGVVCRRDMSEVQLLRVDRDKQYLRKHVVGACCVDALQPRSSTYDE